MSKPHGRVFRLGLVLLAVCACAWLSGESIGAEPLSDARSADEERDPTVPLEDPSPIPSTAAREIRTPAEILAYFIGATGFLAGVLALVGAAVRQPGSVTIYPLDEYPEESDYLNTVTDQLMALGFTKELDFTIPELPHQGFYRLMSTRGGEHTVMVLQIVSGSGFSVNRQYVNYMEYQTILDNGGKINTNNSPLKGPFIPPPDLLTRSHPRVLDPKALFDLHRADVAELRTKRGGRIKRQKPEEFASEFVKEWRNIHEYQVEKGLLKRAKESDTFRGTLWLVLRHLSPNVETRDDALNAFAIAMTGACAMVAATWAMPFLVEEFGVRGYPAAVRELEACVILLICLVTGYAAGTGGYLLGLACYVPAAVVFLSGPLGYFIPVVLSANTGQLGEKLRNMSQGRSLAWYRQLSPEVYISAGLLILAALPI
ncbi:MAG: hypothetical protein AB1646_11295 [Thermodesulfobacteriota bacterium]